MTLGEVKRWQDQELICKWLFLVKGENTWRQGPGKGPPERNTSGPFMGPEMGLRKGCCPTFEGALSWFLRECTWQFLLFLVLFLVWELFDLKSLSSRLSHSEKVQFYILLIDLFGQSFVKWMKWIFSCHALLKPLKYLILSL